MAINVLDVRDTFAAPHVRVPALRLVRTGPASSARRPPVCVLAAGSIAILEAVALLALAVSGIDDVLTSPARPANWIVALGLSLLAAWVVLTAGGGGGLLDRTGRRLLVALSYVEVVAVAVLLLVATLAPVFPQPAGLPLSAVALLLAVPVAKLLLAGAPSARQWVAVGPRPRKRRPDPVAAHRPLATLTLGVIGISLGAIAVLGPVPGPDSGPGAVVSTVVYTND